MKVYLRYNEFSSKRVHNNILIKIELVDHFRRGILNFSELLTNTEILNHTIQQLKQ